MKRRRRCIGVTLLTLCLSTSTLLAQAPRVVEERGLVPLVINGTTHDDSWFITRGSDIWVPVAALRSAGVTWRAAIIEVIDDVPYVSLRSLEPAVTFAIDRTEAVLSITAGPTMFQSRTVLPGVYRTAAVRPRPRSAFLNYALSATSGQQGSWAIESGTRAFGGLFLWSASGTAKAISGRGSATFTFDDERRLARWQIGDVIVDTVSGSGVRAAAGVSYESEFGIDPGFTTFAPVHLTGATAVPAVAEVYVNGRLASRTTVAPGAYELADVAAPIGAGDVRVVLRDQFGRETTVSRDYYRSPALLRKGLTAFRYAAGMPRQAVRGAAWRYDGAAASAEHRWGLTDRLTVGASGRIDTGAWSVGGSASTTFLAGELEFDHRVGGRGDRRGTAALFAYTRRGNRLSGALSIRARSMTYRELDAGVVDDDRAIDALAALDVTIGRGVSVGARYRPSEAGLTASLPLAGRLSLQTSVLRRTGTPRGWQTLAALTVPLSPRSSAALSVERRGDGVVAAQTSVQRSLGLGPGVGYRAEWQDTGAARVTSAALLYQHTRMRVEARHDQVGGRPVDSLTASGALVALGGLVRLSAPVTDAFAIVQVAGTPGVRTFLSNQFVGRTGRGGDLIVPSLTSYNANRIDVDDSDLPATIALAEVSAVVAPALRGGVALAFEVESERGASIDGGRPASTRQASTVRAVLDLRTADSLRPVADALVLATWPSGEERVTAGHDGRVELTRAPVGRHVVEVSSSTGWYACVFTVSPSAIEADGSQHVGIVPCDLKAGPNARVEPAGGQR